jgi:hypothetical protein
MKNCVFCLLMVVVGLSGCSDSSAPQAVSVLEIDIEITDSITEEGYLRAEVSVENVSARSVIYFQGCESAILVSLTDSDGNKLRLRGPSLPKCLPQWQDLLSSQSVDTGVDLIWAWEQGGIPYAIQPGAYTFNASFSYYLEPGGDTIEVEKRLQIEL